MCAAAPSSLSPPHSPPPTTPSLPPSQHCLTAKAIYDWIEDNYADSLGATWRDGAKGAVKTVVAQGELVKPQAHGSKYYLPDSPALRKAKAAVAKKAKAAASSSEGEEEPQTPKGRSRKPLAAKGGDVTKSSSGRSSAAKKAAPAPARKTTAAKKAAADASPRAVRARARA